ncbi:hypothetical protein HanRHA438_Chr11g0492851 [Helianthus annuus]|nr:hypothetical protein HanRHA438_Chr11g0492851 [Helianthus annuus]
MTILFFLFFLIGSCVIGIMLHYATFEIMPHADWDDTCRIMPHGGGIIFLNHYGWSNA